MNKRPLYGVATGATLRPLMAGALAFVVVTGCGGTQPPGGGGGGGTTSIEYLRVDNDYVGSGNTVTVSWSVTDRGTWNGEEYCRLTTRYEGGEVTDLGLVPCVGSMASEVVFPTGSRYIRIGIETKEAASPYSDLTEFVTVSKVEEAATAWSDVFGTTSHEHATAVGIGPDGSVVVAGETWSSFHGPYQGNGDIFVVKFSSTGALLWGDQFGSDHWDNASAIAIDSEGNVFVVGTAGGELLGTDLGGTDAFIRKYSSIGSHEWTRVFGDYDYDDARAVVALPDGSVVAVGSTTHTLVGGAQRRDVLYYKYSPTGDNEWNYRFGPDDYDLNIGSSVTYGSDGSIYIGGSSDEPSSGATHHFVMQVSDTGWPTVVAEFDTLNLLSSFESSIAVDEDNNVYFAIDLYDGDGSGRQQSVIYRIPASGGDTWTKRVFDFVASDHPEVPLSYAPIQVKPGPGGSVTYVSRRLVGESVVPVVGSIDFEGNHEWLKHTVRVLGAYSLGIWDVALQSDGTFVLVGIADVTGGTPDPVEAQAFVWKLER